MRARIRVLDAPGCYERPAQAERKSALQGSGLVRTVRLCAQRRVALMSQAIATARDALSNDRRYKASRISRGLAAPAKQALVASHRASSEARGEVCSLLYLSVVQ